MAKDIRGYSPKFLDDAAQEIFDLIKEGRFTPFLGAGASSLRPRKVNMTEAPWQEIGVALRKLDQRLANEPATKVYLCSFGRQRLSMSNEEIARYLSEPNGQVPSGWPNEGLIDLQCSIIRLATFLGDLFGVSLAHSHHAVTNIECEITTAISGDEEDQLSELLFNAVDCAAALKDASTEHLKGPDLARGGFSPPLLEADSIYGKLLQLTIELVNRHTWESARCFQWQSQHNASLAEPPLNSKAKHIGSGPIILRFEQLAWLSDLLWYTLRFWSPNYPTTSELAFELALIGTFTPPRKAELAQAAEALADEDALAQHLQEIFGYYETVSHPSVFHLHIAAMLHQTYHLYMRQFEAFLQTMHITDDENQVPCLPIAFTTNFDRALERALDQLEMTYHVIYPVREVTFLRGEKIKGIVKWRYRTCYKKGTIKKRFPSFGYCHELAATGHIDKGISFEGPIVVKLHGSPLDDLDEGEEHWLVLAESGYLEAMIGRSAALPPWIEDQLRTSQPQRSLWFLGYSVGDWNIRLRLYEHLHHSFSLAKNGGSPSKNVIDRRLDDFRVAIFPRLGIQPYIGDLNDLPGIVFKTLKSLSKRPGLSPEVKEFLAAREGRKAR